MRGENNEDVEVNNTIEEKEGKLIYWTDYDENMGTWNYLTLTVEKI